MIKIYKYGEVANDEIFARVTPTVDVAGIVSDIIKNIKENGDSALLDYTERFDGVRLQSLAVSAEEIEEAFYNMVEEYWLFEAYNECLTECLSGWMEADIESGEYTPISFDEFIEELESGELGFNDFKLGRFEDFWDQESKYNNYLLNCYYSWVCEHDHEFIAKRVGLDLDACRDDEVDCI